MDEINIYTGMVVPGSPGSFTRRVGPSTRYDGLDAKILLSVQAAWCLYSHEANNSNMTDLNIKR